MAVKCCLNHFKGPRFVIGSTLFTDGGVKPLEYFIQLLRKNHLQVFLKAIFVKPLHKNPNPVNCALSPLLLILLLLQWSPS